MRVEVTYQLAPGEDAALVASVKAAEVERARLAAWARIQDGPEDDFDPTAPGLEPPDEYDPFPDDADYVDRSNGHPQNGDALGRKAGVSVHPESQVGHPVCTTIPPSATPSDASTGEAASKPQQMAIQMHCKRLGLSNSDLTALLRSRYGKFRLERLTKDEAAQVMRLLERGEWRQELQGPASTALAASIH